MSNRNIIFDGICRAVLAQYPNADISSIYTPTPSSFPAVFVYEVGHIQNPNAVTLVVDDEQKRVTWECQVISNKANGGMSQAYNIMEIVERTFNQLYFVEISEAPISIDDETKFRLMARFRRTIGGGDTVPTIVIPTPNNNNNNTNE